MKPKMVCGLSIELNTIAIENHIEKLYRLLCTSNALDRIIASHIKLFAQNGHNMNAVALNIELKANK